MSFFKKIKGIFTSDESESQVFSLTDDMLDDLECALMANNFGEKLSLSLVQKVRKNAKKIVNAASAAEVMQLALEEQVERLCGDCVQDLPGALETGPRVILLVGSNGSGKTTLTAKLCKHYKSQGLKVLLALGDTFRAAALEQSQYWAENVGVEVFQGKGYGADPAAVAFDAAECAKKEGFDILVIDTAGRLHTSVGLMQQLEKMVRVLKKVDPAYPHETSLVLDSTMGSYMVSAVEAYAKYIALSSYVLTKGDGFSGGGAFLQVLDKHPRPILCVSFGEDVDSLGSFSPSKFAQRVLLSTER